LDEIPTWVKIVTVDSGYNEGFLLRQNAKLRSEVRALRRALADLEKALAASEKEDSISVDQARS